MTQILLDDLVFHASALPPAAPSSAQLISTRLTIKSTSGTGLKLRYPMFCRRLSVNDTGTRWSACCATLRKWGIPLFASVADLESVSASEAPPRIASRALDQSLSRVELLQSDAFELANQDRAGTWSWPYEVDSPRELKHLVKAVRDASGAEVPIGVSLPLDARHADLRACLDANLDFLTLVQCPETLAGSAASRLNHLAINLVTLRRWCRELQNPDLPILMDAPVSHSDHLIKLLALGATAVNVSELVRSALGQIKSDSSESKFAESLLGGRPAVARSTKEMTELDRSLQSLIASLHKSLQYTGALDVCRLDASYLRSTSVQASETLGIPVQGSRA